MRRFVLVVALLAGCRDPQAGKLGALKDQLCACKTASCAEQLIHEVPRLDVKSTQRTQEIAHQMLECLARLETAPASAKHDDDDEPGSAAASAP